MFIKTSFSDSKKSKERKIMYENASFICIFRYNKIADFQRKNTDDNGTQEVCHVIHNFLNLL